VADTSNPSKGPGGGAVICAALLLVVGYALVNQEKLPRLARELPTIMQSQAVSEPGGKLRKDLSETTTMTFGKDGKVYTLETYWTNDHLHYRARVKVTPEKFDKVVTAAGKHVPVMRFSLQNRFGEELVHLEIPAERFHRAKNEGEEVMASGSLPVAEANYRECIESSEGNASSLFPD
jgi:hypothetical protein